MIIPTKTIYKSPKTEGAYTFGFLKIIWYETGRSLAIAGSIIILSHLKGEFLGKNVWRNTCQVAATVN